MKVINMDENKSCQSRFCADKSEISNSLGGAEFSLGSCLSDLMPLAMATGFGGGAEYSGRGLQHSCSYLCTHLLQHTHTLAYIKHTVFNRSFTFEFIFWNLLKWLLKKVFKCVICMCPYKRERACDTVCAFLWFLIALRNSDELEQCLSFTHCLFTHTHKYIYSDN